MVQDMTAHRRETKPCSVRDTANIPTAANPTNRAVPRTVSGRGSHKCRPGSGATPEQLRLAKAREDYLTHLRRGISLRGSAGLAGISFTTVCKWRQLDPGFRDQECDAILDGTASLEDRILKASESDWRAAERLLQVRDPERWAPKGDADVAVNVNFSNMSEAEAMKKVCELERKLLGRVISVDERLPGMTAIEGPGTEGDGDDDEE